MRPPKDNKLISSCSAVTHKLHSRLRFATPPALWARVGRGPAPGFGTVDFVDNCFMFRGTNQPGAVEVQ